MEHAMMLPVLPGIKDTLSAFTTALMGERKPEMDLAQATVTKETWHLIETPMGDFCIVYFEAPDPMAVLTGLATSEEPFDVWFRDRVQEITGIDIASPPPTFSNRIYHWTRE